jgi:hypothetical protein
VFVGVKIYKFFNYPKLLDKKIKVSYKKVEDAYIIGQKKPPPYR